MTPGTIFVISSVMALASVAPDFQKLQSQTEAKRYYVTQAPEPAAACIARNAQSQRPGAASFLHPLYGMEHIAVVMRNSPAGDTVATVYLEPATPGSHVKIVPTSFAEDPEALVKHLLAKC